MSIAGVFKAVGGSLAGGYVATKVADQVADRIASHGLDKALSAVRNVMQAGAGQNYVSKTANVRIEPFTLIDTRALRLQYIKDVLNTAQRLFIAYYSLSVTSDNKIGSIKVARQLDKFAPDRSLADATLSFLSTESYQSGLPFVGELAGLQRYNYSAEAFSPTYPLDESPVVKDEALQRSSGTALKPSAVVQDVQNLAIGQLVDITLQDGKSTGTVQVMVRLRTMGMDPVSMVELMALGGEDNSYTARWRKFRVGELELWRDLVLSQDRIDNYRRAVSQDKTGYFRKAHRRSDRGLAATLLTGQPSIGEATSICIMTKETQLDIEDRINGRFSDFATRQSMFEDSMLMLLFVIDADHETVAIYTRDIEDFGVHALRDMKSASNGKDSELSDIMKSYLEGKVPGRL